MSQDPRTLPTYTPPQTPEPAPRPSWLDSDSTASDSNPNKTIRPELRFGAPRPGHIHAGTDFGGPENDTVGAADDGEVVFAGPDGEKMGNAVKIRHADGSVTVYGHLNKVDVAVGAKLRRGDPIGLLGTTGNAKGPHVHFEVRQNGANAVDPMSTAYRPLIGKTNPAAAPEGSRPSFLGPESDGQLPSFTTSGVATTAPVPAQTGTSQANSLSAPSSLVDQTPNQPAAPLTPQPNDMEFGGMSPAEKAAYAVAQDRPNQIDAVNAQAMALMSAQHQADIANKAKRQPVLSANDVVIKKAVQSPDALQANIEWHFGPGMTAAMLKLPIDQQRQMITIATAAAARDAAKKEADPNFHPQQDPAYQAKMRSRIAGLKGETPQPQEQIDPAGGVGNLRMAEGRELNASGMGAGELRRIEGAHDQFKQILSEETNRTVMPGDKSFEQRLIGRGLSPEGARAIVNSQLGPPTPSVMQSPAEQEQTRLTREKWERDQVAAQAIVNSNALTDKLRDESTKQSALTRILRILNPVTAVDAATNEPLVHVATAQTGPKLAGGTVNSTADLLHFVDTLGGNIEGNTYVTEGIKKLRDLGSSLQASGAVVPKGPAESFVASAANLVGEGSKFAALKAATGLPFWALMGGDAALRTQDQPLSVQAVEIPKAILTGVAIDYGPGLVVKALGKMPGAVGALARQFPVTVGSVTTGAGFGGLAAEEVKRRGGTNAEAAGAGLGAALAVGGLSVTGTVGEARNLGRTAIKAAMQSDIIPETGKDFIGDVMKYGKGVATSDDGRVVSLYVNKKTGDVFGNELTPEEFQQYDPDIVTGTSRPVRNRIDLSSDQYDVLLKTLKIPTTPGAAKGLGAAPNEPSAAANAASQPPEPSSGTQPAKPSNPEAASTQPDATGKQTGAAASTSDQLVEFEGKKYKTHPLTDSDRALLQDDIDNDPRGGRDKVDDFIKLRNASKDGKRDLIVHRDAVKFTEAQGETNEQLSVPGATAKTNTPASGATAAKGSDQATSGRPAFLDESDTVPDTTTAKTPAQTKVASGNEQGRSPDNAIGSKRSESPSLPTDIAGAKPRYSAGTKKLQLEFADDIDRAAYITAQATPSKRDADYLAFVMKHTGYDEAGVRSLGVSIRGNIKRLAASANDGDTLKVPAMYRNLTGAQKGSTKAAPLLAEPTPPEESSTGLDSGFKHMGGAISESLYRGMFDRMEAGKLPAPFPADKQPAFEQLAKKEYEAGRVKNWRDLWKLANPPGAEPDKSSEYLATAQEIADAGKPVKLLGTDASLETHEVINGVSYELYKTKDVGIIRVLDQDSRKIVELLKYPTLSAAQGEYVKALDGARRALYKASPSVMEKGATQNRAPESINALAHEAATSPENDRPQPTEPQKEAGNYKKGHIAIAGLNISIENPAGSKREGVDPNGKHWSVEMKSHYGYIRRTEGADGEHVDLYVRPGTPEDYSGPVFVVNQVKANGHFDEHKAMLGWSSEMAARSAYAENYTKGWKVGEIVKYDNPDQFKQWLEVEDQTKPAQALSGSEPDPKKRYAVARSRLIEGKEVAESTLSEFPALRKLVKAPKAETTLSEERGMQLHQAVRKAGGIAYSMDRGKAVNKGELEGLGKREGGYQGLINNESGVSVEQMANAMAVEGYGISDWAEVDDVQGFEVDVDGFIRALKESASGEASHTSTQFQGADNFDDEYVAYLNQQFGEELAGKYQKSADALISMMGNNDAADLLGRVHSGMGSAKDEAEFKRLARGYGVIDKDINAIIKHGRAEAKGLSDAAESATNGSAAPRDPAAATLQAEVEQIDWRDREVRLDDDSLIFKDSERSATLCTGYACELAHIFGPERTKIFGFDVEGNPKSQIAVDWGGHDFAVMDDRFIVDPWLSDTADITPQVVFDLENPDDTEEIKRLYGDRSKWLRGTLLEQEVAQSKAQNVLSQSEDVEGTENAGTKSVHGQGGQGDRAHQGQRDEAGPAGRGRGENGLRSRPEPEAETKEEQLSQSGDEGQIEPGWSDVQEDLGDSGVLAVQQMYENAQELVDTILSGEATKEDVARFYDVANGYGVRPADVEAILDAGANTFDAPPQLSRIEAGGSTGYADQPVGDVLSNLDAKAFDGRLNVNRAGLEVLQRAFLSEPFFGTFLHEGHVDYLRDWLKGQIQKHIAAAPEIRKFLGQLNRAAKDSGTVSVFTDASSLKHEGFHQASQRAASGERNFIARHGDFRSLVSHRAFAKARKALLARGYADQMGSLVEETAAYLWEGKREMLGLTESEGHSFLEAWMKSYEKKNGGQSLEAFEYERENAQAIIDAIRATANQRRQDARRVSKGRTAGDQATDAQSGDRGEEKELDQSRLFSKPSYPGEPTFMGGAFYSQLYRTVFDKMPNKASADRLRALLAKPQSGVKPDEMRWSGLDDYLKGKDQVTKDGVLQFLRAADLGIQENQKGGMSPVEKKFDRARLSLRDYLIKEKHFPENGVDDYVADAAVDRLSAGQRVFAQMDKEQSRLIKALQDARDARVDSAGQTFAEAERAAGEKRQETHEAETRFRDSIRHVLSTHPELERPKPPTFEEWLDMPGSKESAGGLEWEKAFKIMRGRARQRQGEDLADDIYRARNDEEVSEIIESRLAGNDTLREMAKGVRLLRTEATEAEEYVLQRSNSEGRSTERAKFENDKWRVPGRSENYRELVFTIPDKAHEEAERIDQELDRRAFDRDPATNQLANEDEWLKLAAERDRLLGQSFKSSHWRERNVIAHSRVDDRETPDKKRFLLANDVQSDWHQAGRDKGYDTRPEILDRLKALGVTKEDGEHYGFKNAAGKYVAHPNSNMYPKHAIEGTDEQAELIRQYHSQSKAVMSAPFAKSWHEFVMRRLLHHAVEGGYDYLAWATGDQAADMFDLRKFVSKVEYMPRPNGATAIRASDLKGNSVEFRNIGLEDQPEIINFGYVIPNDRLADVLGKDVAKRIVAGAGEDDVTGSGKKYKRLAGLDLAVGGEGMRGFYDQMIPAYMRKLGRKFGAEVTKLQINPSDKVAVFKTKAEAESWVDDHRGNYIVKEERRSGSWSVRDEDNGGSVVPNGRTFDSVHAVNITPEMRDSVEQGQPLFKLGERPSPQQLLFQALYKARGKAVPVRVARPAPQKEERPDTDFGTLERPNVTTLSQEIAAHFGQNGVFNTIVEARQFIGNLLGGRIESGTPAAKIADEAVELGAVRYARIIAGSRRDESDKYDDLVNFYETRQPTIATRSSTSIRDQAYSTPLPLGFLASRLADVTPDDTVGEPTAGNGALLLEADRSKIVANELNPERYQNLVALFPNADTIKRVDAAEFPLAPAKSLDVILANPPFGVVKEEGEPVFTGKRLEQPTKEFKVNDHYTTTQIDHAIALKALEAMKDDGRAVLIVASVKADTEKARSDGYNGKAKREFYKTLYDGYNVVDHFTVSGDLYKKQGAAWPVDVIVIHGRGKSALRLPAADVPRTYENWNALGGVLDAEYRNQSDLLAAEPREGGEVRQPGNQRPGNRGSDRGPARSEAGPRDLFELAESSSAVADQQSARPGGRAEGGLSTARPNESGANADARAGERGGSADLSERSDAGASQPDEHTGRSAGAADEQRRQRTEDRPSVDAQSVDELADREVRRARPVERVDLGTTQVPYRPASKAQGLDTKIPVNMKASVEASLERLMDQQGDVDSYVGRLLGYDPADLSKYFSAEQVDAIALALNAISKDEGFIIGDQGGIGKGRVVAAVIKYGIVNDRPVIFVTEKPNLFKDIVRDLVDIGEGSIHDWSQRAMMTNFNEKVPLDDDQTVFLKTGESQIQKGILQQMMDDDSLGHHQAIFTTYAQMQTVQGEETIRQKFLKQFVQGAILILDESHNAGGSEVKKPKKAGVITPPDRAELARELVQAAHGVFYSSATYAKRPSVMDLYSKTDMSKAVDDPKQLADTIARGGVPLQQVVASMLADAGQYIRRERDFTGMTYETVVLPVDHAKAESSAAVMRAIRVFDEFKAEAVEHIKDDLKAEAGSVLGDNSVGTGGVHSTNFTSLMHNLVDQLTLMMKADGVVEKAIEALKRGEKPVITTANTMGAFIERYAKDNDLKPGDAIDINFGDMLKRYLERSREVLIGKAYSKNVVRRRLTDEELGPRALAAFDAALKLIRESDWQGLPVSPIDYIMSKLAIAGYKGGEITGRQHVIDYSRSRHPVYRRRPGRDISIAGRSRTLTGYNNGAIDYLFINQAGASGLSVHASSKFRDQRVRHMLIAQAERNIDTFMQLLYRVDRTGQVVKPKYSQLVGDIPAEKRPGAVLSKKMASLNANTTAAKGSAYQAKDTPDFMNEYGDEVMAQILEDNPEIHRLLGKPLKDAETGDGLSRDGAIRKATGRIPLLPVPEQERLYDIIEEEYREMIQRLDAMGENDLEAQTLDLDAKTLHKTQVFEGTGDSPFAQGADAETVDVKKLGKPYTTAQVLEQIAVELKSEEESFSALQREGLRHVDKKVVPEVEGKFEDYLRDELDGIADVERARANRVKLEANYQRWKDTVQMLAPGQSVEISSAFGVYAGVVTRVVQKGAPKNPVALGTWRATIAVADAVKQLTIPFSKIYSAAVSRDDLPMTAYTIKPLHEVFVTGENGVRSVPAIKAFDEGQSSSRERRTIMTGNLLAGFARFRKDRGRIINYTDDQGQVRQGILMPAKFNLAEAMAAESVVFNDPKHVLQFLDDGHGSRIVESRDHVLTIGYQRGKIRFAVPASKAVGGQYYLNRQILDASGGNEFVKSGQVMQMVISAQPAANVIRAILAQRTALVTNSFKDEARRLTGNKPSRRGEAGFLNLGAFFPSRSGESQDNFSFLTSLRTRFVRGGSQLRAASPKSYEAFAQAAGTRAQAAVISLVAAHKITRELGGTPDHYHEFLAAGAEGRLRGVQQRWLDLADSIRDSSDEETEEAYDAGMRSVLQRVISHSFFDAERDMLGDVLAYVDSLAASGQWAPLRSYLGDAFDIAADNVAHISFDGTHDWFERYTAEPRFQKALEVYKREVEKPASEAHEANEGVFSDALGPLDTWFPLIPIQGDGTLLSKLWSGRSQFKPYKKPENQHNRMATGLAERYDLTPEMLNDSIGKVLLGGNIAHLLNTLETHGLVQKIKTGQPYDRIINFKGVEYKASPVSISDPRTIYKDKKVIHVPGRMALVPNFIKRELRVILEGDFSDGARSGLIGAINFLGMVGPIDAVFHADNVMGALVAGTPFVGTSMLEKSPLINNPILKKADAIVNIIRQDPLDNISFKKLMALAKLGMLPDKFASETFSRAFAKSVGAKWKPYSFGPFLYGPKGLDVRTRLVAYDVAKEMAPDASATELIEFIGQMGIYNKAMQSEFEQMVKGWGIAPFYTAGSTMLRNGIRAWTGRSKIPDATLSTFQRNYWRLAQHFGGGVLGLIGLWILLHKMYRGKYPWQEGDSRLLQIKLKDSDRKSRLAKRIYGDNDDPGYAGLGFLSPMIERGARALGVSGAYETALQGGSGGQIAERVERDAINSLIHPVSSGPMVHAAWVTATGAEPYLAQTRDPITGRYKWGLKPAIGATEPGLPTYYARAREGLLSWNNFNQKFSSEVFGIGHQAEENEKRDQANNWVRMALDMAVPRLIKGTYNRDAMAENLAKQRKASTPDPVNQIKSKDLKDAADFYRHADDSIRPKLLPIVLRKAQIAAPGTVDDEVMDSLKRADLDQALHLIEQRRPVEKELQSVGLKFPQVDRKLTVGNITHNLTDEEFDHYQSRANELFYSKLPKAIQTDEYKTADPLIKNRIIKDVESSARTLATAEMKVQLAPNDKIIQVELKKAQMRDQFMGSNIHVMRMKREAQERRQDMRHPDK